jgi:hypothetical protein
MEVNLYKNRHRDQDDMHVFPGDVVGLDPEDKYNCGKRRCHAYGRKPRQQDFLEPFGALSADEPPAQDNTDGQRN